MEQKDWMLEQINKLAEESQDYRQIALYQAFVDLINEQYRRIEMTQGEIDGRMWSRNQWDRQS
ncbi:hypothetical protein BW727_101507 [Jeotgalibaca dankookensis]|uniref:Uncharacterized protein n=1 Tax=Jeotgalibaca dankookensis TaxID=708126 RepID=A0A1S6IQR6_9LACT|nr:hypothetical protein [Jeotgalibaca dankookensis]AQS53874.1 hypothetical protein BW727_101507 [Jeotgalibaca dankookensis]